jgi:tripartite-type tricarboxylate transporter receptor subunit TctC
MVTLSMTALVTQSAAAQSVAEFYKGNTINIYVGYAPGGAYDFYARLFGRHIGKYIPGNPNVVIQSMPGAGTLRAANYLFNVAPKDGTALGVVTQTLMVEEAFGTSGVKYKSTEYNYIGRMSSVVEAMIVWHTAKAKTIQDVRQYETIAGGNGPTSPTEGYPRLLNAFAGTRFKIVSGYKGTTDVLLAMERGEVEAVDVSWNTIIRTKKEWLETKKVNILVQAALERTKALPDTPTVVEMGNTEDDRAALALYTSSAEVSRPLIGTPGIPADRLKALREAFMVATRDPELLAEIKKAQIDFDPAPGEYLQELAGRVAKTPREIVLRAAAALLVK